MLNGEISEEEVPDYPSLWVGTSGSIVLVTSSNGWLAKGTIIFGAGKHINNTGVYKETWDASELTKFTGKITLSNA